MAIGSRPLCQLPGHHAEKRVAIGRRQGVGVPEIHLVLKIGVFVIGLVDTPAQTLEALVELTQEAESTGDALVVVARFHQIVDSMRIPAAN